MQKVQTNEKEKMTAFKQVLVSRIEAALTPVEPEPVPEKTILLLPMEYENFSEIELYKELTLNTELKHTPQTAVLAIETLKIWNTKLSQVANLENSLQQYKLDLVDLVDRIEKTEQKIEECLFNTASDVELKFVQTVIEEENIDFSIEELTEDFEPILIKEDGRVVYKVPADFETMTEPQLIFNLYERFHYTKRVASDLYTVLSGKIPKPPNMEFEFV